MSFTTLFPATTVAEEPMKAPIVRQLSSTVRLVGWRDHLLATCRHNWGFPFTDKALAKAYREHSFNAHQTCSDCGAQRFYSTATMQTGPEFQRIIR
jgi:hypothetical protein